MSPRVLPLIPGYLSYISGVSLEELRGMSGGAVAARPSPAAQRQVMVTSLFFILGFSLVFVALGASATCLGTFLMQRLTLLGRIAGVLIIIFGLHSMGVSKIGWLLQETVSDGIRLLAIYSLGLAIPFLLTALAINQFFAALAKIRR